MKNFLWMMKKHKQTPNSGVYWHKGFNKFYFFTNDTFNSVDIKRRKDDVEIIIYPTHQ